MKCWQVCIGNMSGIDNTWLHNTDITLGRWSYRKVSKNIVGHICSTYISGDLITGRGLIGSFHKGSVFNQVTWLGYYWYMVVNVFYKYFSIDCPCISNSIIVLERACISCQCSPALGKIFIDVDLTARIWVWVYIFQGWLGTKDPLSHISCGKFHQGLSVLSLSLFPNPMRHSDVLRFQWGIHLHELADLQHGRVGIIMVYQPPGGYPCGRAAQGHPAWSAASGWSP